MLPPPGSLPTSPGRHRSLSPLLCSRTSVCVWNSSLFQLCFLCSLSPLLVQWLQLFFLRSSLWPHLWHWHSVGTEERPVEWPLRQGGKEQRPMGYLYFTSILVFSSSVLSSLLSTTEQTLSRNERPCNPSQCFTVLISDEHVPTLSISLTDFWGSKERI